jgi:nucleoside phosphorylase
MSDEPDAFIKAKLQEQRAREAAERQRQERLPAVRQVATALREFKAVLDEYSAIRGNKETPAKERDAMREKVADGFIEFARRLKASGDDYRLEPEPSLTGPFWTLAQDLYQLGRHSEREKLLSLLNKLESIPAEDQSELWHHVAWFREQIMDHTEAMWGVPLFGRHARRFVSQANLPADKEQETGSTMPTLDPDVQSIVEKARAKEKETVAGQRDREKAEARFRRAHEAWLRVSRYRGDAIPPNVRGDALHQAYAEIIVQLGQVLKEDGWLGQLDAVSTDSEAKIYAIRMLRHAADGDVAKVMAMVKEGIATLFSLGLEADSWLREGLMYQVLGIQPAPELPIGWEGAYFEPVETPKDFINWIDAQFLIHEMADLGHMQLKSDGRLVRNAFRLVAKLALPGMPLEPTGPFEINNELAVLRNLRRLCADQERARLPETQPVGRMIRVASDPTVTASSATLCLGIVIALKEEFGEFFREIKRSHVLEIDQATGNRFYRFERTTSLASYSCIATWAGEMGPEKAALVTERLIELWKPETVVNLGIAAAIDKDLRVGDVLIATQVDNYLHRARAVPSNSGIGFGLQWGGQVYPCSQDLLNAIRNFQFAHFQEYRKWRRRNADRFRQFVAPEHRARLLQLGLVHKQVIYAEGHLASGPIVGASRQFREWLKERDRAFLGLDMEAAGVLTALFARANPRRSIVLRGISDYGDERKADLDQVGGGALRRYAMCNTLHLFWLLLKNDAFSH